VAFPWHGRVALFIDGQNINSANRDFGWRIDWKRVLEYFSQDASLVRAYYYTSLPEGEGSDWLNRLLSWLEINGYTVDTKQMKKRTRTFVGESGIRQTVEGHQGDMDVHIAVDMMRLADRIDTAILFSGDGDMCRLVEAAQDKGVRVVVVSTERTSRPVVSRELRETADWFIDLADLREEIGMKNGGRSIQEAEA